MSFSNGSFSLTRYRVLGREKRLSIQELNKKMQSYQARGLRLQGATHEMELSWVLPENPELEDRSAVEKNWSLTDCLYEDGILLRIRVEKRSVPAVLLTEVAKERWMARREADKENPEPERVLKKQVLEEVKDELLRMSLPSLRYIEAFWRDQEDSIYLFSQGKMARESFEDLFRKSFGQEHGLTLIRILPPLMGVDPWADDNEDVLSKIRQTLPGGLGAGEIS